MDLEDFKYAGTNLTAFRLVDPDNADVRVSQSERVEARIGLIFHQNSTLVIHEDFIKVLLFIESSHFPLQCRVSVFSIKGIRKGDTIKGVRSHHVK